jgi:anaerobic ribonucleoside-triphosphate reductase activating protein
MEDIGEILDENVLAVLLEKYRDAITCVCFMGGDSNPQEVERLSVFLRNATGRRVKTAWYSGRNTFSDSTLQTFDYIKLGAYIEALGGLDSPTTNQRFYRIEGGAMVDWTERFWKR